MKILVVAATNMEIAPFTDQNTSADILVTGVGAPATMYALTRALQQKKYDFVMQAGIAGTFKNGFAPGETFAVKSDVFADLGIHERDEFFTLFDKGFANADESPYSAGRLENTSDEYFSLPVAHAITINTITDKYAQTSILIKKYDPDIESMEGAAFHYVCISEGVKFLQLRSISNFVGERIKTNWKMKESISSLNENLKRIIKQLQNTTA